MRHYRALTPVQAGRRYEIGEEIPAEALGDPAEHLRLGIVEPVGDTPDGRSARIQAAIAALPAGTDEHWTKSGKPDLNALRREAGMDDITGAERDREWLAAADGGD